MLKADSRERVAILGVKSSRYLCLDSEGAPFTSVSHFILTLKRASSSRVVLFLFAPLKLFFYLFFCKENLLRYLMNILQSRKLKITSETVTN